MSSNSTNSRLYSSAHSFFPIRASELNTALEAKRKHRWFRRLAYMATAMVATALVLISIGSPTIKNEIPVETDLNLNDWMQLHHCKLIDQDEWFDWYRCHV